MITKVNIPVGTVVDDAVEGNPPRVKHVMVGPIESPHWGLFVGSLEVVGRVKFSNFATSYQLISELRRYCNEPMILHLTDAQPEVGYVTEVILPKGDLGVTLKGFPPIVTAVASSSPILEMVHVGERVERLIIPDYNLDLSLSSGGFTSDRVTRILDEHQNVDGRILIVVQHDSNTHPAHVEGENSMFDWGSFRFSPNWTLRRMFSNRPSHEQHEAKDSRTHDHEQVQKYVS